VQLAAVDGAFVARVVVVADVVDVDASEDGLEAGRAGDSGTGDFVDGVAAGEVGGLVDAHFGVVCGFSKGGGGGSDARICENEAQGGDLE
jgi:hypothetical protein